MIICITVHFHLVDNSFRVNSSIPSFLCVNFYVSSIQSLILGSGTIEDGSNGETTADHYHHYLVTSFWLHVNSFSLCTLQCGV